MASNRRKTKTGLPMSFPAGVYNDILDVIRDYKRSRSLGGAAQRGAPATETRVLIKNASGSAITNPFSVLEVSARLGAAEDYRNKKTLQGVTPTSAARPVAILQAGAASGELVEAVVAGTTLARVNVVSTSDRYADAVSGDSDKLKSGAAGRFEIVEPLTSTGIQVVQVRFAGGTAATTGLPKVKNLSGYTVPEWGFLLVDGVDPLPSVDLPGFMSSPVFRGVAPNALTVFGNKRIVSVPGGAAPGETVDCILDGRVPARVYSEYKTGPLMAHLSYESSVNDVSRLNALHDQTNFGFPILYRERGTGEKWALVDLMPQNQPAVIIGEANLTTGIFAGGSASLGSPFTYQGNPWTSGQLWQNGIVRTLSTPTALLIDGPSAWIGEAAVTFGISYSQLPLAGSSGFYRVPGFRAIWSLLFPPSGFDYGFNEAVEISERPGLVAGSDYLGIISGSGSSGTYYTLTQPIFFQSAAGPLEKNFAQIISTLSVQLLGGSGSGRLTVTPINCSLFLHEVDPMLERFTHGGGGVVPVGGYMSSGSVPDPLAPLKSGITSGTGFLTSSGFRTVTPGSGFGFE